MPELRRVEAEKACSGSVERPYGMPLTIVPVPALSSVCCRLVEVVDAVPYVVEALEGTRHMPKVWRWPGTYDMCWRFRR